MTTLLSPSRSRHRISAIAAFVVCRVALMTSVSAWTTTTRTTTRIPHSTTFQQQQQLRHRQYQLLLHQQQRQPTSMYYTESFDHQHHGWTIPAPQQLAGLLNQPPQHPQQEPHTQPQRRMSPFVSSSSPYSTSPFGITPPTTTATTTLDILSAPPSSTTSSSSSTSKAATTASSSTSHGMPWQQSICSDYTEPNLFYMPFWEWQMQYMKTHLTNLREIPVVSHTGRDMSYAENNGSSDTTTKKKPPTMRIHTCCFTSEEYKLIRLTVVDGGYQTQVFTSLWYPANTTDPVLGIDLLQFNHAKKHLCIVDFQPVNVVTADVTEEEEESVDGSNHNHYFEDVLKPIRDQYPRLQGTMTDRFYNSNDVHFSKQMLLGRHSTIGSSSSKEGDKNNNDDADNDAYSMVYQDLFPAYQQYVTAHVQMVRQQQQPATTTFEQQQQRQMDCVTACHRAYDTYSAARDPAHGLLSKCFGSEWADDYVYDILFPLAQRPLNNHDDDDK